MTEQKQNKQTKKHAFKSFKITLRMPTLTFLGFLITSHFRFKNEMADGITNVMDMNLDKLLGKNEGAGCLFPPAGSLVSPAFEVDSLPLVPPGHLLYD